jgi:hypothetical protein
MAAPLSVADTRADRDETIVNVAKAVGKGKGKITVFEAVYWHKKKVKTVDELMATTGFSRVKVLQLGGALAANGAFHQVKTKNNRTGYQKDPFVAQNKTRILNYARHPAKAAKVATKSNPKASAVITIKVAAPPRSRVRTITIEDLDAFAKVRKIGHDLPHVEMPEAQFQRGMEEIIGEPYTFPGWGGEKGDLQTTRVRLNGKRVAAAFAFKGPGFRGVLTPSKMGKRGDQVLNLFHADAEVFFVQSWGPIGPEMLPTMHRFASYNAAGRGTTIRYGVIDGEDSARIIAAFPKAFGPVRKGKRSQSARISKRQTQVNRPARRSGMARLGRPRRQPDLRTARANPSVRG